VRGIPKRPLIVVDMPFGHQYEGIAHIWRFRNACKNHEETGLRRVKARGARAHGPKTNPLSVESRQFPSGPQQCRPDAGQSVPHVMGASRPKGPGTREKLGRRTAMMPALWPTPVPFAVVLEGMVEALAARITKRGPRSRRIGNWGLCRLRRAILVLAPDMLSLKSPGTPKFVQGLRQLEAR